LNIIEFLNSLLELRKERPSKARHQWLVPVILTTQEAEIKRIAVRSQQIVQETLSRKKSTRIKGWWSG
jgi:hypothetical protein